MTELTRVNGSVTDLADLDFTAPAEEGAIMEVRHPVTGETLRHEDGHPFTITLVGRDSERFLKLVRQQSDRRIQASLRTRQPISTVSVEKDDIELLVNATLAWDILLDKKPAENSQKAYRDAYARFRWLKEQVDEFVGSRANFLKG